MHEIGELNNQETGERDGRDFIRMTLSIEVYGLRDKQQAICGDADDEEEICHRAMIVEM